MKGVKEAYSQFIFEHDVTDKSYNDVIPDLMRMLNMRFSEGAPRRAPKMCIVGPPGSGRHTQSMAIAQAFGLVHISARELLKAELARDPEVGKIIAQCQSTG